jgi:Na+/melibiose symporter-like transporter
MVNTQAIACVFFNTIKGTKMIVSGFVIFVVFALAAFYNFYKMAQNPTSMFFGGNGGMQKHILCIAGTFIGVMLMAVGFFTS